MQDLGPNYSLTLLLVNCFAKICCHATITVRTRYLWNSFSGRYSWKELNQKRIQKCFLLIILTVLNDTFSDYKLSFAEKYPTDDFGEVQTCQKGNHTEAFSK